MTLVRQVQDVVCAHFGISRDDMLQRNNGREFVRPRQIAMFLAREYTPASFPKLGREFCRDHTTVLYAVRSAPSIESDPDYWPKISAIRADLESPRAAERRAFEIHMREKWKRSIPYHLTPEYAASLVGGMWS